MIGKHVDLFAIGAVLLAIFVYTKVQGPVLVKVFSHRVPLRIQRIIIQPPEPPVFPIALLK